MEKTKNAVFFCQFKLRQDASVSDFLAASKKLNDEHISKQKGYVSWKQLNDGDTWVDILTFETMEDVKNFENNAAANPNQLALNFYSFINMPSCKVCYYTVEAEHGKI